MASYQGGKKGTSFEGKIDEFLREKMSLLRKRGGGKRKGEKKGKGMIISL